MPVPLLLKMNAVPDLNQLKWRNRVLLIFAPAETDARLSRQDQLIKAQRPGFDERDLKVFSIVGAAPANAGLRKRFHVSEADFSVVLIGKDGTRKLEKREPVAPEELFRLIDTMPMRRSEMQK